MTHQRPDALVAGDVTVSLLSGTVVVHPVSLRLAPGETLGVVGESGSGKTTLALALLGYARSGMRIAGGRICVSGEDVDLENEGAVRKLRGRLVGLVPQDPSSNLNPSLRIGDAIKNVVRAHANRRVRGDVVLPALDRVGLPATAEFSRRFPHQLSGGQQQRVLIACALACEPPLIVLDEPTTGLDVVTQARILDEIAILRRERSMAMVYVSHDLAVVAEIADRIAVMYAGYVVEEGPVSEILTRPRHPYTRGLLASCPDHRYLRRLTGLPGVAVGLNDQPTGCPFSPRCPQSTDRCLHEVPALEYKKDGRRVRCYEAHRTPPIGLGDGLRDSKGPLAETILGVHELTAVYSAHRGSFAAVRDVSFSVARGECLALVGESGSGKTTIARVIAGLHPPAAGDIVLEGVTLAAHAKQRRREERRKCQIIFQNPFESLNPRHTVGTQVARPARILRDVSRVDAQEEVSYWLERVRLPLRTAERFPVELSGGERQRVAIARALAAHPDLIVCDEITSALDVSVQAAVIDLLAQLQIDLGLALLFITHNLGVVASIGDRVLVLDNGRICEAGSVDAVFRTPSTARTKELLASSPTIGTRVDQVSMH